MDHPGHSVYKVYINDDPGLTLTYFMASSNSVKITCYAYTGCQVSLYRIIGPLGLRFLNFFHAQLD